MKAIEKLLRHPKVAGNQSEAARLIGKSQQNISNWINSKRDESDIPVCLIRIAAKAIGEKPSYLIP